MSFKTVFITKPAKISLKNENLIIEIDGVKHSQYLHDIHTLLIENNRSLITTAVISALAKSGAVVLFVDNDFLPASLSLPLHTHSLHSKVTHAQLKMGQGFKKQLWKALIRSKIDNQATVLRYIEKPQFRLQKLADTVKSNDSGNNEAKAAKYYWHTIFSDFVRETEGATDIKNSALNYAYAILRSAVARAMVGAGLNPTFGVFHQNYFNPFNFVDDMIEPFRPVIDLHVYHLLHKYDGYEYLTTELKAELVDTLNHEYVDIDKGLSSVRVAVEITINSLQKAIMEEKLLSLQLPAIDAPAYSVIKNECI